MNENDMKSALSQHNHWFRLAVYAVILILLAALLYREATLGRNLGSVPVGFVCLAGATHLFAGFTWRRAGWQRLLSWSTWLFTALGVVFSLRLMLPI